jgi:hypothetical protein
MKRIKILTIITFLISILLSCEKEVEFKGQLLDPKLVVNSFIYNDSLIEVKVYATHLIPGFESTSPIIKNAEVTLFDGDKEIEKLEYKEVLNDNTYSPNYGKPVDELSGYVSKLTRTEIGKKYRLEVSHPNYQTVICETTIPAPISILKIDTVTEYKTDQYDYTEENFILHVSFADRANETNYYRFVFELYTGELSVLQMNPSTGKTTDYEIVLTKKWSSFQTTDKLLNPEENANDILFEGGSENSFFIFDDLMINGKEYRCPFSLSRYNYDQYLFYINDEVAQLGAFIGIKVTLQTLSYDAYYYIKSLQQYDQSGDMGLFVEPTPVYSNIKNGVGVLGGVSSQSKWIFLKGSYPQKGVKYRDIKMIY